MSSRVWVCVSSNSSTKVLVLDATQPADLLDSFYACNTHVGCIASVPGRPMSERTTSFIFIWTVDFFRFVVFVFVFLQASWRLIFQQEKRFTKTQRLDKVMGRRWPAVLPA